MRFFKVKFSYSILITSLFSIFLVCCNTKEKTIGEQLDGTWINNERNGYYIKSDGTFQHYIKEDDLEGVNVDEILAGAKDVPLKEKIVDSGNWQINGSYIVFIEKPCNYSCKRKFILQLDKGKFGIFDPGNNGLVEFFKN
jgi:hypothetical protein